MNRSNRRHLPTWLCVLLIAFVPAFISADQDPTTDDVPRVVPYQGFLNLNGKPLTAQGPEAIHIRFSLYDGVAPGDVLVYEEDEVVEVFAGRFSVLLGPSGAGGTEIATVVAAADEIYLGITLLGIPGDPADDIELSGRQLITPTPYALWSTTATNLQVANNLTVGGTTEINGALQVNNDATVSGSTRTGSLGVGTLAPASTGEVEVANDATVGNDVFIGNKLTVNDNALAPEVPTTIRGMRVTGHSLGHTCTNPGTNAPPKQMTPIGKSICFLMHSHYFDVDSLSVQVCSIDDNATGTHWHLQNYCAAAVPLPADLACAAGCLEWDW